MELRIPGPTPCPPAVLEAMTKQMINHRGREFSQIFTEITARLKDFFQTKGDVLLLTGSGTGGLEAAVANCFSPGDKVLAVSNGAFGDRFAAITQVFGAQVQRLNFPWGAAVDPEGVRQALNENPDVKGVLVTHNETSTGITNDLQSISAVVKEFDKLLLVDAISSLGCVDLPMDAWGCDVVVNCSQKGWMIPPGLAMIGINERGWQAVSQAKMPRFYWDFNAAKQYAAKGQTPWTPAVSLCYALLAALEMMAQEGMPNIFARHARVGRTAREGVKSLGLTLFADEAYASNTVTAINAPTGVNGDDLRRLLEKEYQVVLAEGQGKLVGRIFRIGHLGWVSEENIQRVMEALAAALPQVGFTPTRVAASS
ncbi:MAG: alanine--glyoxylate aminotransferase family protein [Chloroflexi bacterium]|nr:alanine--glyoxylate aminotransferase family protein [Chloroflexota bacterium]